jgi:capsular polysaccharide biosynthesis protein
VSDAPFTRTTNPSAWEFASALGRSWFVLLLATAATAGAVFALSTSVLPKSYSSQATLLVDPAPGGTGSGAPTYFVDDQSVGKTFEQLALQPVVASAVAKELDVDPLEPQKHVVVHAVPKTPLVQITYTAGSPADAARGAAAYSNAFLRGVLSGTWLKAQATIVSPATTTSHQTAPRTLLDTVVAGIAGFLLAVSVVCLRFQSATARERATTGRRRLPLTTTRDRDSAADTPVAATSISATAGHLRRGGA